MKPKSRTKCLLGAAMLGALAIGGVLTAASSRGQAKPQPAAPAGLLSLTFGSSTPLAVHSPGVEWAGNTYHLVTLDSIRFDLDKDAHLTASLQAEVTAFDQVDYDLSGAVFDAAGQMLGTARSQCKVARLWEGYVLHSTRTISLDFGSSLDYARASGFLLSVSNRKVRTPAEWQK